MQRSDTASTSVSSRRLLTGVTLLMSAMCLSSSVMAEEWIMPTPFGAGNPPTQVAYEFAEDVMNLTDGELRIQVKAAGKAVPHLAIPGAVMSGEVVIGEFLLGILDKKDSVFAHDVIPFLTNDYQDAQWLWQAAKKDTIRQLEKLGLHYLYVVPWTPYGVFSKQPIQTVADFEGKSMRAFTTSVKDLITAINAIPLEMPLNDVVPAFKAGKLDARFASLSVGEFTQAWTYAPYLNDLRVWTPKEVVVMNKAAYEKLDPYIKGVIDQAAVQAEKKGWKLTQERVEIDLATLKAGGVVASTPSTDLLNALAPIGQRQRQEWINRNPKQNGGIYQTYRKLQKEAGSSR